MTGPRKKKKSPKPPPRSPEILSFKRERLEGRSKGTGIASATHPPTHRHIHTLQPLAPGRVRERRRGADRCLPSRPPRPAPASTSTGQAPPRRSQALPAGHCLRQPGTRRSELCRDKARSAPAMDRKVAREFRHKVRAARGAPSAPGPSLSQWDLRAPGSLGSLMVPVK